MEKLRKALLLGSTSALLIGLLFSSACTPGSTKDLGIPASNVSFTIAPVAGKVNTYVLTAAADDAYSFQWDRGDGTGFKNGKKTDTAYYLLKGSYAVKLRAFGRGGNDTANRQVINVPVDDVQNHPIYKLLAAKTWKLNGTDGANAIIVGTEGNPGEYFGGGALADCQKDDVYTFTNALQLTYAANGATFNGGNIAPSFNCGIDRSYASAPFTFTLGGAGGAVATIGLGGTIPARFIGVTDISSNNYRIMSISATSMVLRSGLPSEVVHQFKFVAQ